VRFENKRERFNKRLNLSRLRIARKRKTMSAAISGYASSQVNKSSRAISILTRLPMVMLTVLLTAIALRYLVNPVQTASAAGITFTSPGGITVARVGFAGFPLAFAVFFLTCLFSQRILYGLRSELALLGIVIGVRVLGMALIHSAETAKLLVPEFVLVALCVLAIRLELSRWQRDGSKLVA
jgi:hypothetical protein